MTHTAEFEEANRKLMELNVIEEKLEITKMQIQKVTQRINWCLCITALLLLIMGLYALYYYLQKPDDSFQIK